MNRASLIFEDGRCVAIEVARKCGDRCCDWTERYDVTSLVSRGLLSITDRMILNQIAARVDKITRQLDSATENGV